MLIKKHIEGKLYIKPFKIWNIQTFCYKTTHFSLRRTGDSRGDQINSSKTFKVMLINALDRLSAVKIHFYNLFCLMRAPLACLGQAGSWPSTSGERNLILKWKVFLVLWYT